MKVYLASSVARAIRSRGYTGELPKQLPAPGAILRLFREDGEVVSVMGGCCPDLKGRRIWSVFTTWENG